VRLMLRHQPDLAKRVTVSRPREMAELLFTHGMDPNRPNWLRKTPLHDFAQRGDIEAAALYLDHGADIEARDEERCWTPLAWAAAEGRIRMVEFLLRRGARVDDPGGPPWAKPVAVATRRGHDAIVRMLTDYEKSGTLPPRARIMYDSLAADLADAFSGNGDAMRRVIDAFTLERPLTWDRAPLAVQVQRLRQFVRERLGGRRDPEPAKDTLPPDEAKALVARAHGHKDWDELMKQADD